MDEARTRPGGFAVALAIASAMVLTSAGVGVAVLLGGGGSAGPMPAMAAGEVGFDLREVPSAVAAHYHAAARDADAYAEVPCFCGCDAMLGHRSLLDCFVRPGGGWERHASGCAVCLDESATIRTMLARGSPIAEIRADIVDTYTGTAT